jgi:hypothetical protein|tara:strand:- start:138 stop:317 length:180 start_codon:yes stop_codon:yes gene_type:complete
MKIQLDKQEADNIILACEWFMDELRDNSTFEIDNKAQWYEFADLVLKIKTNNVLLNVIK